MAKKLILKGYKMQILNNQKILDFLTFSTGVSTLVFMWLLINKDGNMGFVLLNIILFFLLGSLSILKSISSTESRDTFKHCEM